MRAFFLTLVFIPALIVIAVMVVGPAFAAAPPPPDIERYLTPARPDTDGVSATQRQLLMEAGRTLGFRGGKAARAWALRETLELEARQLDALYDFRPLISRQGWLPPVINEARDVAHITSTQIRTATRVYEILLPARFVSNPPSWRRWLHAGLAATETDGPEAAVIPENRAQKALWQRAVRLGWSEGQQSADQTLAANFNRLTRDYRGMLMYSQLRQKGAITAPVVTEQQQTVTGSQQKLMTGDRVRRLKAPAGFVADKTQWRPVISGAQPDD